MSEPISVARRIDRLEDDVLHWTVEDDRIQFRSDAYAVPDGSGGWVAIDPLPLTERVWSQLRPLSAICLTGAFHQRSAWAWRDRCGAPVWSPAGARRLAGKPDREFGSSAQLPGGIEAQVGAGPGSPHAIFVRSGASGARSVFCGDLLIRSDSPSPFRLVTEEHRCDPEGLLASVRYLETLAPERLFSAHGAPLLQGATQAIHNALESETHRSRRK